MSEPSNFNKVVKGVSFQTFITLISGVEAIVYFSIMSRLLSREEFGMFAAVTAITVIFSSMSTAGIGSALIQRKEMTDDYKNTSFTLSFITGLVLSSLLLSSSGILARFVIGEQLHYPLMLMSITILIGGLISVNISWMYRHMQFLKAGLVKLSAEVLSSVSAVILAFLGFGLYAIILKVILKSILTLLISYFFVNTKFRFKLKREYVRSIFHFGGWLTASVIINNISSQIDRLLMSRFLSLNALGSYNRPKEFISQINGKVNEIFDISLFPILSGVQDQKDVLRKAFNRSQYLMNIFSMGLSLAFICNSELLIRIFLGERWLDLKLLFQILSLGVIYSVNGRIGDCFIRSLGLVKQQFNLRLLGLLLNVVGILIGFNFGIMGVAIGTLLSSVMLITIKNLYLAKYFKMPVSNLANNVFGGWHYGFYFIPFIIAQYYLMPSTWLGNILSMIFFVILIVSFLFFFPQLIGKQYKEELQTVVANIKKRFVCV